MKNIIDNLRRQHRELTQVTMQLVPLLDAARLARDASQARRHLGSLSGILKVHVSMEDCSFYPFLLSHRDPELRQLASRFLAERDQIQERYLAYSERWQRQGAIEAKVEPFISQTRAILLELGQRMMQEDREFHPRIVQKWEADRST